MNTFDEQVRGVSGAGVEQAPRGFWANLGLIRPVARGIALILFFVMLSIFWFVIWPHRSPQDNLDKFPAVALIFLSLLAPLAVAIYVLLIGFIHVDAKRRGMRYVMWTLLAIFIPNAIGIILYFILRDPLPTPCPKCSRLSAQSFTFCPSCGSELMRTCRVCHKKLGQGWANCAYCGTSTTGQVGSSAPMA